MTTEMQTETTSDGLAGTDAAPGLPKKPLFSTRSLWVAVLCGVACAAVMAAVIVMANRGEERAPGATAEGAGQRDRSDLDVFGGSARRTRTPATDFSACGPLDPDNPPEIAFGLEDGTLDLGLLKQGVKVEHEISFRNTGKGPLCVGKVSTGCGCLKVGLVGEKKRYEPGEEGRIRLIADTTGRVGILRKTVSVLCNDAKSPRRSFRVKMDVSAGLLSEPRHVQFGNVPPGTAATRTMILRSTRSEKSFKVLKVESARRIPGRDPVAYTFEVESVKDPRYDKLMVRITHPGYTKVGAVNDLIAITTDHPERKRIDVRAHIHVVPRIRSKTRLISLGFVQPGVPRAPTTARIESPVKGVTFALTKVEIVPREGATVGPAGVGFNAKFGKDKGGWWVSVTYDGKSRGPGLLEGALLIHTDDKLQPLLRVPVRATVRSAK